MAEEYDVVVLGGGTGGYVAAVRASQLGLKVAIVEKSKLGGTCLHQGCIPSKALLRSAEVYKQTKESETYGIETENTSLNFVKVQERKQSIIDRLHKGVQGLMKKGKIDIYEGHGRILGPSIFSPTAGTISVERNDGADNTMIVPKNVIIATGSSPRTLPGLDLGGDKILSSDHALQLTDLPKSILIVGGGVIGIEWASMLNDFDVDVTVIEYADRILPTEDQDISREMTRMLKKKGVKVVTKAKVIPETVNKNKEVSIEAEVKGKTEVFTAEKMLVSVGRVPNVDNIGLENTDIEIENGAIKVNKYYQTKESHIYAIGDVIGGMQLAHVASHEGIIAMEHIANENPDPINYENIPTCIYSNPEVASVGLTEQQAVDQGYDIKIGKFPFQAVGKALVYGEANGFVKIIANKQNDDLLGVHMIGPHVTDMISEAGLAKVLDATPWEISQSIHPHPTLSEVIGEAALAVDGKQIHG
ncbi:dihydrolipoyl dehydrogenase [Bacillaceae bacterium W0354]